ncbi:MAG: hypothetical protein NTX93_01220 [Bacteroidia bacterium]|nr:hypothetical protein [Bacteroidia bacterium]
MKTLIKFIFGFIIFVSVQLQAKENDNGTLATPVGDHARNDTLKTFAIKYDWVPSTSLYIELGGKFIPSLNIDFRKRENFAVSIGISYWFDSEGNEQSLFLPSVMCYYLKGKRHRLELGGGLGPFIGTYSGLSSIMLFGNVGYRYQKKKGLIFRIGFTPCLSIPIAKDARFMAFPWAGISFGYSF